MSSAPIAATAGPGLAHLLREPSANPLPVEVVVAVPARGVERWVTRRLLFPLRCPQVRVPGPPDPQGLAEATSALTAAGTVFP